MRKASTDSQRQGRTVPANRLGIRHSSMHGPTMLLADCVCLDHGETRVSEQAQLEELYLERWLFQRTGVFNSQILLSSHIDDMFGIQEQTPNDLDV